MSRVLVIIIWSFFLTGASLHTSAQHDRYKGSVFKRSTKVQRLIETESFKPLSLSEVAKRLGSASQRGLDASMMSLEQVGSLGFETVFSQKN